MADTVKLREALEPLAQICEPDDFAHVADGWVVFAFGLREITMGDIRRARAALAALVQESPQNG